MPDSRPRVLMTLADVAWPVDAGKRLRAASMVRAVAARCEVDVVVLFADTDPSARPLPPDVDAEWEIVPPLPRSPLIAALDVVRRLVPWQIAMPNWPLVQRTISARQESYDLVWFGALDHFERLHQSVSARKTIVDCDDVETEKLRNFLALPSGGALAWTDRLQRRIELPLWGRIQRRALRCADAILVCSDLDRTRLIAQATSADPAAAARVVSVPNTYPEPTDLLTRQPNGPCTLVMIANYGTDQNVDAVAFVARQLLPVLLSAVPGARIRLVGRRVDRLRDFEGIPGLDLVGPVESVSAELAGAHAVLVPIRFGGGTRLKVIEALAYGVPVVSTRVGAEGIAAADGEHLLLGDSPQQITAAVQRLLGEPGLATRLSLAGRVLYERSYRPEATTNAVGAILDQMLDHHVGSRS